MYAYVVTQIVDLFYASNQLGEKHKLNSIQIYQPAAINCTTAQSEERTKFWSSSHIIFSWKLGLVMD